jgi:hypothetical protein
MLNTSRQGSEGFRRFSKFPYNVFVSFFPMDQCKLICLYWCLLVLVQKLSQDT